MSDLFNIPDKDRCGVYTITNRRTGKKYIGSSTQLKKRAKSTREKSQEENTITGQYNKIF